MNKGKPNNQSKYKSAVNNKNGKGRSKDTGRQSVPNQTYLTFSSPNCHYRFNTEYFELTEAHGNNVKQINTSFIETMFIKEDSPAQLSKLNALEGYSRIRLQTEYPGLLIGIGNQHLTVAKEAIEVGFSFDYVTGHPYVPGSSLKGVLRSHFPNKNRQEDLRLSYFETLLPNLSRDELSELESSIFDNHDVFLDSYPNVNDGVCLLEMDYITPHSTQNDKKAPPSIIKNPIPIPIIKVKPGVSFDFAFMLKDSLLSTGRVISVTQKKALFEQLLLDFGLGAKTNTGYGQFRKG